MKFIVARHSPKAGLIEPLPEAFSAHQCIRGREIGIKPSYDSREDAEIDAKRLEAFINDPSCHYRGTLVQ